LPPEICLITGLPVNFVKFLPSVLYAMHCVLGAEGGGVWGSPALVRIKTRSSGVISPRRWIVSSSSVRSEKSRSNCLGRFRRLSGQTDAVLAKPFTPVQLVVAVRAALDTMRPVVVIVESGRVYQRLIHSALEQESVKLATVASFDEGLQLASQTGAAVLFTPEPEDAGALARLRDLRRKMPALAVVALASDGPRSHDSWYDRRLIPPYSAQSVGDAILHVLNLKPQIESALPEWAYAHKNGH